MLKNAKKIAEIIGVELNEWFEVENETSNFILTEKGLFSGKAGGNVNEHDNNTRSRLLGKILHGHRKITRIKKVDLNTIGYSLCVDTGGYSIYKILRNSRHDEKILFKTHEDAEVALKYVVKTLDKVREVLGYE